MRSANHYGLLACFVVCLFAGVPAFAQEQTEQTQKNIFPPANEAVDEGFLYFPKGGSASLYSVPILADDKLVQALGVLAGSLPRFQMECTLYQDRDRQDNGDGKRDSIACFLMDTRNGYTLAHGRAIGHPDNPEQIESDLKKLRLHFNHKAQKYLSGSGE